MGGAVRSLTAAACFLILLSGCRAAAPPAGTPTPEPRATPAPDEACSAARLTPELTEQDVPAPARITRQAIVEAAVACDYEKLGELAQTDDRFTYSLAEPSRGEGWNPVAWWEAQEDDGIPVLATLVRLLDMRPVIGRETHRDEEVFRLYVWPRAFDPGDTVDTDWEDVQKIHDADLVEQWRRANIYHGWRLGITDDGRWIYYVSGDCSEAARGVDPRLCPAVAERPVS